MSSYKINKDIFGNYNVRHVSKKEEDMYLAVLFGMFKLIFTIIASRRLAGIIQKAMTRMGKIKAKTITKAALPDFFTPAPEVLYCIANIIVIIALVVMLTIGIAQLFTETYNVFPLFSSMTLYAFLIISTGLKSGAGSYITLIISLLIFSVDGYMLLGEVNWKITRSQLLWNIIQRGFIAKFWFAYFFCALTRNVLLVKEYDGISYIGFLLSTFTILALISLDVPERRKKMGLEANTDPTSGELLWGLHSIIYSLTILVVFILIGIGKAIAQTVDFKAIEYNELLISWVIASIVSVGIIIAKKRDDYFFKAISFRELFPVIFFVIFSASQIFFSQLFEKTGMYEAESLIFIDMLMPHPVPLFHIMLLSVSVTVVALAGHRLYNSITSAIRKRKYESSKETTVETVPTTVEVKKQITSIPEVKREVTTPVQEYSKQNVTSASNDAINNKEDEETPKMVKTLDDYYETEFAYYPISEKAPDNLSLREKRAQQMLKEVKEFFKKNGNYYDYNNVASNEIFYFPDPEESILVVHSKYYETFNIRGKFINVHYGVYKKDKTKAYSQEDKSLGWNSLSLIEAKWEKLNESGENNVEGFNVTLDRINGGEHRLIKVGETADKNSTKPITNKYLEELNKMQGLATVKEEVTAMIKTLDLEKMRKKRGLKNTVMSRHLVFTGKPGTGKTTVARIIAKIYKSYGIIENENIIEVDRADLVGVYIGDTAQKTKEMIRKAYGGILFIDEAYTLYNESEKDFGKEAIDTLLKEMEDKRDKFIVIAAGYPDEMDNFIYHTNPGLPSRFATFLHFDDYSAEELYEIFKLAVEKDDYFIDDDIKDAVIEYFTYKAAQPDYSNGRDARNLKDACIKEIALNIDLSADEPNVDTITPKEVNAAIEKLKRDGR